MTVLDRPYYFNQLTNLRVNDTEEKLRQMGWDPLSNSYDPTRGYQSGFDALLQARAGLGAGGAQEAARGAYMNRFLGGGPAGPTFGGVVSGPYGSQGDRAIKAFQTDEANPVGLLQQMGINIYGADDTYKPGSYQQGTTVQPNAPPPTNGFQPQGASAQAWLGGGTGANANPASMMDPSGGVMATIGSDFGFPPGNTTPTLNNPGWGQVSNYWGSSW
jgi:hypothetical protein